MEKSTYQKVVFLKFSKNLIFEISKFSFSEIFVKMKISKKWKFEKFSDFENFENFQLFEIYFSPW